MNYPSLLETARRNIHDTVTIALGHTPDQQAVIVYDNATGLSKLLAEAYHRVLPDALFLNFDTSAPDDILKRIDALATGDLVVLIQSTSFRFTKFRIRIELFERRLKVIEHPHLGRIRSEEYPTYIDSLAYDPSYYRSVGPRLRERIASAARLKIIGKDAELYYNSPFLDPKPNIGFYEGMKNIGGQFPIGEIFTEPRDVTKTNGTVRLFAFGGPDFSVRVPDKPFTAIIQEGHLVSSPDAPKAFLSVLDDIRSKEEVVWVRELGFGLNRALTRERRVSDIGTYERMLGLHLSLGSKHLQYKKAGFPKRQGFHVDVFIDTQRVEIDGVPIWEDGCYTV